MRKAFLKFIHTQQLVLPQTTTLLAVSGGVDSVVMCSLFCKVQLPFAVAHCNFNLRAAASQADEDFVRQLAKQYQVDFYTQLFDAKAYATQKKISVQMAARTLRYQWFETLLNTHALAKVATAHHANDSLETCWLNFIKGTGIAGLHGILPKKDQLIRPLLFANKAMIVAYAKKNRLKWREDRSNGEDHYQRNFVRNKVIPLAKVINPNVEGTMQSTLEKIRQTEMFLQAQIDLLKTKWLSFKNPNYYLDIRPLQKKSWGAMVAFEILKPFGFNFTQIQTLLSGKCQSGKTMLSKKYILTVDRNCWIVSPNISHPHETFVVTPLMKSLNMGTQKLAFRILPKKTYAIATDTRRMALNFDRLTFPLTFRKWQKGDIFYPLGMLHRKKISDFLIDLKLPNPLKAHVYVATSAGHIVAVLGYRIDNHFKLTATTQQVYEIATSQ